ncbi:putative addiction module killer protein [Erwinia persicina]|uniref:Type II toxin-antitoxin system RelE/ParE family toxin n=1 Tax=Erwinia aeris TaxID=3239803 RepID=A0ABV4E6X4_9GAMM|nr:type II toxin-antitoxin system RelE/ParE family toxin [Erwinia persicina]MCP1438780.1 putative addiction module killer protein [Erwinia persicina]
MAYKISRYQDRKGNVPFATWMTTLRKKQREAAARIDNQIDRTAAGNFGDHKFVRDGVWEMRINHGPGYRVYYAIEGKTVILLFYGGDKNSQPADIAKAISYLHDYNARKDCDNHS